jgi:hypothetical protein
MSRQSTASIWPSTLLVLLFGLLFVSGVVFFLPDATTVGGVSSGGSNLVPVPAVQGDLPRKQSNNNSPLAEVNLAMNGKASKKNSQQPEQSESSEPVKVTASSSVDSSVDITQKPKKPAIASFIEQQKSKYAYVTLIAGIDSSFRYRGFLYNALIMRKALLVEGSTADFVAMVGYSEDDHSPYEEDMARLRAMGIIVYDLPRWVHEDHDLSFAEMALLKITPWSFTQYEKVQFFDGDVMPTKNMDCLFKLKYNSFTAGAVSALNSGWYLGIPNMDAFKYMRTKAIWRLGKDWDKETGWAERMPEGLTVRGGAPASKLWDFNGSDMDQGLLLHYHVINHGQSLLIDTTTGMTSVFEAPGGLLGGQVRKVKNDVSMACCKDISTNPTAMFAHFTGRGKPWMLNDDNEKNRVEKAKRLRAKDVRQWFAHLDSLRLPGVNSSTIGGLHLGSPLGFWNHNFPKGGFNLQDKHVRMGAGASAGTAGKS